MSKGSLVSVALILFLIAIPESAHAQSRDSLRTDFGIELLGKGLLYSFSYQQMLSSSFGVHASLEAIGGSDALVVAVPFGGTAYLVNKDGSPFVSGGIGVLLGSGEIDDLTGTLYGFLGPGFEYRANSGFVFRGTLYGLIRNDGFLLWPGLHVGYAF
ncbi:MAG: hypothetical protein HKN43_01735 [Rhodothermales bacterium]|nr:hypothetical protein [Rhodothermales bacterium]